MAFKKSLWFLIIAFIFIMTNCASQKYYTSDNPKKNIKKSISTSDSTNIESNSSQGLDSKLHDLTEQISKDMRKIGKKKIAVIEFQTLDGDVTKFGQYISEELITRLFRTGKFSVVERQLLNEVIEEQKLNFSGLIDKQTAKEFGKILGVDAIVSGSITDLYTNVKINARMIDTKTGSIFAVASAKVLKNNTIKKMMEKKARESIIYSSTKKTTDSEKEKENEDKEAKKLEDSEKIKHKRTYESGEICFQENFNSYEIGDPVFDWGSNLAIKKGRGGRKYLSSYIPGVHLASQKILFPKNFKLEYIWSKFDYRSAGRSAPYVRVLLKLYDEEGNIFKIECGNWGIVIPGLPNKDFRARSINQFKMIKKGNVYKFYNNGKFLISNTYSKYSRFVKFEISVPVKPDMKAQKFTDFKITCLGEK